MPAVKRPRPPIPDRNKSSGSHALVWEPELYFKQLKESKYAQY